jgi:hypothetical protein
MTELPTIGRIVLFRKLDGDTVIECAALVTRVWEDGTANLMTFPDCSEPKGVGSVPNNESLTDGEQHSVWRWPPVV